MAACGLVGRDFEKIDTDPVGEDELKGNVGDSTITTPSNTIGKAQIDHGKIVRVVVTNTGFEFYVNDLSSVNSKGLSDTTCEVMVRLEEQSPVIAGVAHVGKDDFDVAAGDQTSMFGNATDDLEDCAPLTYSVATKKHVFDGREERWQLVMISRKSMEALDKDPMEAGQRSENCWQELSGYVEELFNNKYAVADESCDAAQDVRGGHGKREDVEENLVSMPDDFDDVVDMSTQFIGEQRRRGSVRIVVKATPLRDPSIDRSS